ncbi:MAG: hypothetical protein IJB98_01545 [Clostridia bacterium]|nr:hypothetical protein [Clostridia bacterium]
MSKRVNSAFIMIGKYKGDRRDNREDYNKLFFHDFEDQEGNYRGDTEISINETYGYKYNEDYTIVITGADQKTGRAKLQVKKKHPVLGMVVVQEEVLDMNKCNKVYLKGTDIVIRAGVGELEQAAYGENETDVLLRNIKRVQRIAGLAINLKPSNAKTAPDAIASTVEVKEEKTSAATETTDAAPAKQEDVEVEPGSEE